MLFLTTVALASPPKTIAVTYEVRFDLASMADAVCGVTGICDCTVTWKGEGRLVASAGSRHTYEGRYEKQSGGCHDALELWSPADGRAFHTIELDNGTVREWVAHRDRSTSTRVASGAKAAGQVWLTEMAARLSAGRAEHREQESGDAGGISISSHHQWTLTGS